MKTYILVITASLLLGIAIGYLGGEPAQLDLADRHYNMIHENNALLERVHNRLNQLETDATKRIAAGNCQTYAKLLSSVRKTINEAIQDSSAGPTAAAAVAGPRSDPTKRQHELYDTMKQRIYTYAASGQPLMDAMSSDPEFQQLTTGQKKQLALEIVDRFNRGEITLDQLQGR